MVQSFLSTHKFLKLFSVITAAVFCVGILATATASAHRGGGGYPNYFGVDKPTSKGVCYGGEWQVKNKWSKSWKWSWGHNWGWWGKQRVWVPSWEQLGFSSFDQCIRFVTTPQPESKADCKKRGWYNLGFGSRGECNKYVVLNGGGGYAGDDDA